MSMQTSVISVPRLFPLVRLMSEADLSDVLQIQDICYPAQLRESRASLQAKRRASPTSCFVASLKGDSVGYLFSVPCEFVNPPVWNAETCQRPAQPDCLYLHDLAVRPDARKSGAGSALVDAFVAQLRESSLARASLVSVQDSALYWECHGFRATPFSGDLQVKLGSYGGGAVYMERAA